MKLHSQLDCNVVLSYLLEAVQLCIKFTANLYELVSVAFDSVITSLKMVLSHKGFIAVKSKRYLRKVCFWNIPLLVIFSTFYNHALQKQILVHYDSNVKEY
jgi:hypothetical protein